MKNSLREFVALALLLPITFLPTGSDAQQAPAHAHLGHVTTDFNDAPGSRGLAVATAEEISLAMMHSNFAAGDLTDLEEMQMHARHVLHLLDPGRVAEGPGLNFGVITGAQGIIRHIELAADAGGASESLRTEAAAVSQAGRAIVGRAELIGRLAQDVLEAEIAADAAPSVVEMRTSALELDTGRDRDQDGEIDLDGVEGGMQQLEDHLYLILEGEMLPRILD